MKKAPKQHAWFMAHSESIREGIRLVVRQEFGAKAYLGEYRWGNNYGINARWQLDEHYDSQFFNGYNTPEDVQTVVDDGFNYCIQVKNFLKQ
jgi:hypothetical protein